MSLLSSVATIGGFTILSRITGFARDMMIAQWLGAGMVADAFFVAFKFPNLFRRLFAEGAFNAAFVPLFSGKHEAEGEAAAKRFAEEAMAVLGWGLVAFVALMEVIMPWAIYAFAPGFDAVPGKIELAADLSRITFPYLLFISLVSLQSGVLNSLGRFAAAAGTPVLLNLILMAALWGLTPVTETSGHALAWGTTLAGIAQFVWLVFSVRSANFTLRPVRPRLTPEVKLLMKRILPGAVGAGVYQVNLLVDTMIASMVSDGAVSYLYYADRVNQLPLGVVGIAIGTALLPVISRQIRAGNEAAALHNQNRAQEYGLLLTVPAAAALASIAGPLVAVLFQHGSFSAEDSVATAQALAAFSLGLPAYVLAKTLTPGFFARHDTATPVKLAGIAMVANIGINLLLMKPLGHVGIALSTAISAWLNVGMLYWVLHKRGLYRSDERLRRRAPRIVLASLAMAGLLHGLVNYTDGLWTGPLLVKGGLLAGLILAGMVSFVLLAQVTGATSLGEIKRLIRRDAA